MPCPTAPSFLCAARTLPRAAHLCAPARRDAARCRECSVRATLPTCGACLVSEPLHGGHAPDIARPLGVGSVAWRLHFRHPGAAWCRNRCVRATLPTSRGCLPREAPPTAQTRRRCGGLAPPSAHRLRRQSARHLPVADARPCLSARRCWSAEEARGARRCPRPPCCRS